jgi:steroid delta-isomerase-like uncharacterized protein
MNLPKTVANYIDAWNRHDGAGIVACFTPGGTYSDPTAGAGLTGPAIAAYAEELWAAFSDLRFEGGRMTANGDGLLSLEWRMLGTNNGSFRGLPPSGKTVDVPGVDIIEMNGDAIRALTGYFDSRAVPEQLGLQVNVQPQRIGPFAFGESTHVQSGNSEKPGAFSLTCIQAGSEDEVASIREHGRAILTELLDANGFISALTARVADRLFTITAWADADAPRALHKQGSTHAKAMKKFREGALGAGGVTSVWLPARINTPWLRCSSCGAMFDSSASCACGASAPEAFTYW